MPRGKVKLAYIERDSLRRKTFRQRSQCLMKKVEEISVMTGEQGCGITLSPDGEPSIFWPPSSSDVLEVIQRFEHFCQIGKCKEMATQDSCVSEKSSELEKQRVFELKEIRESEINYLMNSIFKHGMSIQDSLGYGQSYEILRFMDELSLKCQLKMHELTQDQSSFQPLLLPRVSDKFELLINGRGFGQSRMGHASPTNMHDLTNGGFDLAPQPPSLVNSAFEISGGMGLAPPPEMFSNHYHGMGENGRDYGIGMHASSSNAAGVKSNQGLFQQQFGSTP